MLSSTLTSRGQFDPNARGYHAAYREGEVSLPAVLEAQRTARDVVAQYIDDLATAWNASAALRVFTLTAAAGGSR